MFLADARYMDVIPTTHERYAALTPAQRAEVDAIFASDLAHGWVPKDSDIDAAIAIVISRTPRD